MAEDVEDAELPEPVPTSIDAGFDADRAVAALVSRLVDGVPADGSRTR